MGAVYVFDFGEENGVHTLRINGSKEDLEKVIETCREEKANFEGVPILNHVHRGDWTLLLKLRMVRARW